MCVFQYPKKHSLNGVAMELLSFGVWVLDTFLGVSRSHKGGSGTLSIGATSPEMYQNVGWLFVARAILYVFWYVRFTTRKPWFRGNTSFFLSKRKFVYEMGENSVHAQEPGVDLYVLCKRKAMSQATKRWHLVTSKWPLLGRQKMDI